MSLDPPHDLTLPENGSATARTVLSKAIGRLLGELGPLLREHAAALGPGDAGTLDRLLASYRGNVGPLASVLRRPNVGALIRTLREARDAAADALAVELAALLAFELATLGALPFELSLARLPRRFVSLLGREVVDVPEGACGARFTNGHVVVEGGVVTRPYHAVEGDIVLALADNNPLAMVEAHPDKLGNAIDLGGRPTDEWAASLRAALGLVAAHLPELRAEIDLFLQQIVPVGSDAEKHLSASYREAIGTMYLTLHPSPLTMVEAVVHEFSHNKLNALLELDDVLENGFTPLYRSPVRPDPRPLHGVLLAVHAFVPVARLYERMAEAGHPLARGPSFRSRFEAIVHGNHEGTALLLEHARPTRMGEGLLRELSRWDGHFAKLETS